MIDSDMVDAALNSIAMKFEGQYQNDALGPLYGGWGQFLDGPRPHRQLGLYGTAAGLLVLSLADRHDTPCTSGATKLLEHWWREWREQSAGYAKNKFCQNPRLAFFGICLRNTENETAQNVARQVETELVKRASEKGKWGDYWVDAIVQDVTPRYLATALAALSLSVFSRLSTIDPPAPLDGACDYLEHTLATNSHLTATEKGAIAAAILGSRGKIKNRKALHEIRNLTLRPQGTLSENHSYFYEYRHGDGAWDRDSVYLYAEIMIGIAGFLPDAPPELRLRAEGTLGRVLENISSEGFRPVEGVGRISTVEQAWCCVFLALAKREASRQAPKWRSFRYALIRQRKPNVFTTTVLPVAAVLAMSYATVIPLEHPVWKLFKVVGAFVIFGMYGPLVIKRLFPGR